MKKIGSIFPEAGWPIPWMKPWTLQVHRFSRDRPTQFTLGERGGVAYNIQDYEEIAARGSNRAWWVRSLSRSPCSAGKNLNWSHARPE